MFFGNRQQDILKATSNIHLLIFDQNWVSNLIDTFVNITQSEENFCINSIVFSLLQGLCSPWDEGINFHVYFKRVCYIFQNLQKTSSKLTGVGLKRVSSEPGIAQK